jgi:penicillin-binding protein 1B
VLDPRVAYLMVNLLESVINNGTGAGARSRGFTLPAAGKTGTSHDGWFAGFTSNLLAIAWVGYDDDRELKLPGADSALPIWTEFMKLATQYPAYRDAKPFDPPPGVVCGARAEYPPPFPAAMKRFRCTTSTLSRELNRGGKRPTRAAVGS